MSEDTEMLLLKITNQTLNYGWPGFQFITKLDFFKNLSIKSAWESITIPTCCLLFWLQTNILILYCWPFCICQNRMMDKGNPIILLFVELSSSLVSHMSHNVKFVTKISNNPVTPSHLTKQTWNGVKIFLTPMRNILENVVYSPPDHSNRRHNPFAQDI